MRLLAVFLAICFSLSASVQNWHFKSHSDGAPPQILSGSDLPDRYGAIYLGDSAEKRIYLTFDAGYANENVEKTLDILKAHGASATFFILPGIIRFSKDTVLRMADEGHTVANHSYSHKNMALCKSIAELESELTRLEDYYREETGHEMSRFFRPPEGAFSEQLLADCQTLGYRCVFWSYAYADWDNGHQPNPEKSLEKLLANTHNGMVLLLHPTSSTNAAILDSYLTELESRGYSFGSLTEFS